MTINKRYIIKTLMLFMSLSILKVHDVNAYKPSGEKIKDELTRLNYRSLNYALKKEDFDVMEKYANNFLKSSNLRTIKESPIPIVSIRYAVMLNQIPKNTLKLVQRSVVALKSFDQNTIILNDIIWWTEVRRIDNKLDLLMFLKNQVYSKRRKDALSMLVELGLVTEIENLSNILTFKDSQYEFPLLLRKAELRRAFINNNQNISDEIESEIRNSLRDYIFSNTPNPDKKQAVGLFYDHIYWLLKQLGIYRSNKEVSAILSNLEKDFFYYNKTDIEKFLEKIPKKDHELYISTLEGQIELIDRIETAIDPYAKEPWNWRMKE